MYTISANRGMVSSDQRKCVFVEFLGGLHLNFMKIMDLS